MGKNTKIYGIDIDPRCKEFEENNVEIFTGSQSDSQFLERLKRKFRRLILIDDGGHFMEQQITTFNVLFNHVKDDGVYL